jgi:hypothetical protein
MHIAYVTGSDKYLFMNAGILFGSFEEFMPDQTLRICDFGLEDCQRKFFTERGTLLPAPSQLSGYEHTWYRKASLIDFLPDEDFDALIWLDVDMMLTSPLHDGITALVAEMTEKGESAALCADASRVTLKGFLDGCRRIGEEIEAFERDLKGNGVDLSLPYLNTGFIILTSRRFAEEWRDAVLEQSVGYLFEQNAFNVLAHRRDEGVRLLSAGEWNVHGELLATALTPRAERQARILHAADVGSQHNADIIGGRFELEGKTSMQGNFKIFARHDLRNLQNRHFMRFLEGNFAQLVDCGVMT